MRITINNINKELKRLGHKEEIVRGEGYFYFIGGGAHCWSEGSSVLTCQLTSFSVARWIEIFEDMKARAIDLGDVDEYGNEPKANDTKIIILGRRDK